MGKEQPQGGHKGSRDRRKKHWVVDLGEELQRRRRCFRRKVKEDKIYGYLLHVPQALLYFSCANTNSTTK